MIILPDVKPLYATAVQNRTLLVIGAHFRDRLLIRSKTCHLLRRMYSKETAIHHLQSLIEATEIGKAENVKLSAFASKDATDVLQALLGGVQDHAEDEDRSSRPSRKRCVDVFSEVKRERRMLVLARVMAQLTETEIQIFQVIQADSARKNAVSSSGTQPYGALGRTGFGILFNLRETLSTTKRNER